MNDCVLWLLHELHQVGEPHLSEENNEAHQLDEVHEVTIKHNRSLSELQTLMFTVNVFYL